MSEKKHEKIGRAVGALVDVKQKAYGDSFGQAGRVLKILYPDGIATDQYDDALAVVRIIDKLFRIANKKDALGESPYFDIAGYAVLGVGRDKAAGQ
jgi:RNA-binding protein YlmH